MRNALTVDVEDYFQVQAFAGTVGSDWDGYEHRVEQNTNRALDLFAESRVKATFFTLGWVAEMYPSLVQRIVRDGHELASHGYRHIRVDDQDPEEFREDIRRTKALLEDLGGQPVHGYRAASFSIGAATPWAHCVLQEEGYRYSSSIYPIKHDLYGMPGAQTTAHTPEGAAGLLEIPISTTEIMGRRIPCGGGGYFRLLPYMWSRWAWRRVNQRDGQPSIFYFHPWELDPDQPRIEGAPLKSRFRHYTNLHIMEAKIRRALNDFSWGRMDEVFLAKASADT